ncbi:hypothetical protein J6590_031401 [Homalodisca vitripennis]|nr:hypothetical protein J6590_031401 [Homalodisca vitripennis]
MSTSDSERGEAAGRPVPTADMKKDTWRSAAAVTSLPGPRVPASLPSASRVDSTFASVHTRHITPSHKRWIDHYPAVTVKTLQRIHQK